MSAIKSMAALEGGRQPEAQIGDLLQSKGRLTEQDVSRIVELARREQLRFGEAAIQLGLLSEEEFLAALAEQFDYPVAASGSSALDPALIAAWQPYSAQAEALRGLRSQLRLCWFKPERRLLAVVAASADEGCSEVVANLAICFAQLGERTLLIDCNLRKPAQHTLFGRKAGAGLSNLLAGRGSLRESVTTVEGIANLHLLGAGAPPPNPQELLSRYTFRELLISAAAIHSVVILDTPPAAQSADAQTVAAACGGALLVARRHQTPLEGLARLRQQLEPVGVEIVGAVING